MATQKAVAAHLDLSQAAVSGLVADGILPAKIDRSGYDIDACRVAYVRHLREIAAGRSAGDGETPNLVKERARLARAQAEAQERKNRKEAGELLEMDLAKSVLFEGQRRQRDSWLAWPSRVSPLIAADLNIDGDLLRHQLDAHVHQHMEDLSDVSDLDLDQGEG